LFENFIGIIEIVVASCPSGVQSKVSAACAGGGTETHYCIHQNVLFLLSASDASDCVSKATLSTGVNVIDVSDGSVVNLKAAGSDIAWKKEKLVLYHCSESSCKQTYGYIKDSKGNFVIPKSGDNVAAATSGTCAAGAIGAWFDDKKFCINGVEGDAVDFATGESTVINYVMNTGALPAQNVFNNVATTLSTNAVVVEVSSHAIVLNELYLGKFFFIFIFF